MSDKPTSLLRVDGKRLDGRLANEVRPYIIKTGVLSQADGSAYIECGGTKILVGVFGPKEMHPKHLVNSEKCVIRCHYDMASFSVSDRKRPGPSRRSTEISKISAEALEPIVFVDEFPECVIDVEIEVIQADAGTRVTGLTGAAVALADAGIPMKDLLVSIAFGKIYDEKGNTHVVLDLFKDEDNYGMADVPVAMIPSTGEITLLQMDGNMTKEELNQGISMVRDAVKVIFEMQKNALLEKYKGGN